MKCTVKIKTPPGQASRAAKLLKPVILGITHANFEQDNPQDDTIIWKLDADPRRILKIQRNVTRYEFMVQKIFDHKYVKKILGKALSIEDNKVLQDMLCNQTTVSLEEDPCDTSDVSRTDQDSIDS